MKKILISLIALLVCSLVVFGSGAVGFDDILPQEKVITITTYDGTTVTIPMGEKEEGIGGTIYNREMYFNEGFYVDDTKVVDGSGNWDGAVTGTTGTFSSTLGVTGATTLSSTLGVTGAATLSSTLDVSGATTLATTTLSAASTLTIPSTGTLTASGITSFANVTASGTLGVTGATTLSDTLGVTGATTLTGALTAATSTFSGLMTISSATRSTVKVGSASRTGCLMLGDSGGGSDPVYITASGSTVTAATSSPAICQ